MLQHRIDHSRRPRVLVPLVVALALSLGLVSAADKDPAKPAAAPAAPAAPAKPATPAAPAAPTIPDVLAKVGDQQITKLEAFDFLVNAVAQQQRITSYEVLSNIVDEMVGQKLIDAEAAKANKPANQWLQEQVDKKVPEPTDAEIEQVYNQFKDRLGGATLEQSKPRIVAYLKGQKSQAAVAEVIDGLRTKTAVKLMLEPPRVQVAEAGRPVRGAKTAPVTMIEFSDYQCPFCSRAEETVKQVADIYGDKLRIVFRDYPLSFHQNAQKAAEAAGCAEEQNKFWEMHDKLFGNQSALGVADLKKYAGELGLDQKKFDECLDSNKRAELVKKDLDDGTAAGVNGTPGFFINGRFLNGAVPLEKFTAIIDDELNRAGVPVPKKPAKPAAAAPAAKPAAAAATAPAAKPATPPAAAPAAKPAPAPAPTPAPAPAPTK